MSTIKFFDPKKAYGELSNHYPHKMVIDGKEWYTVTNYVYANLLLSITEKQTLQKRPVKVIYEDYEALSKKSTERIVENALDEAYLVKFISNPELASKLLETGDAKLVYHADNSHMQKIVGSRLEQVRKRLRVQGDRIVSEEKQEMEESRIHSVYTAYEILMEDIKQGRDIKSYMGKTPAEIVANYNKPHKIKPRSAVYKIYQYGNIISSDESSSTSVGIPVTVRRVIEEGLDKNLVSIVRQENFELLESARTEKRHEITLILYLKYIAGKHKFNNAYIPEDKLDLAVNQQLAKISKREQMDYAQRVYDLYKLGMLSEYLSTSIDTATKDYMHIELDDDSKEKDEDDFNISDNIRDTLMTEDLQKITGIEFDNIYPQESNREENIQPTQKEEVSLVDKLLTAIRTKHPAIPPKIDRTVINIYPKPQDNDPRYAGFSPLAYTGMLAIGAFMYPTVYHYVMAKLIAALPKIGKASDDVPLQSMNFNTLLKEFAEGRYIHSNFGNLGIVIAHTMLKTEPRNTGEKYNDYKNELDVENTYIRVKEENMKYQTMMLAAKAISKKFEDYEMKIALWNTGSTNLVYDDKRSYILGTGKAGSGLNFTGKYLMAVRQKLANMPDTRIEVSLNINEVGEFIDGDDVIRAWVTNRVRDMCNVIYIVKNYSNYKYGDNMKIDPEMMENVLDLVYQQCKALNVFANKIKNVPMPSFFGQLVRGCPGFSNATQDEMDVLWSRISLLVGYLYTYIKVKTPTNIKKTIKYAQLSVENDNSCVVRLREKSANCIFAAIVNLLLSIQNFNEYYNRDQTITIEDIQTVVNIILAKHVEIRPKIAIEPDKTYIDNFMRDEFFNDNDEINAYIYGAIKTIEDSKLDDNIKNNRVNFFASKKIDIHPQQEIQPSQLKRIKKKTHSAGTPKPGPIENRPKKKKEPKIPRIIKDLLSFSSLQDSVSTSPESNKKPKKPGVNLTKAELEKRKKKELEKREKEKLERQNSEEMFDGNDSMDEEDIDEESMDEDIDEEDEDLKIISYKNRTDLTYLPPLPENLEELDCSGCTGLVSLPDPLPEDLKKLNCSDCTGLTFLPDSLPGGLEELDCSGCTSIVLLPDPLPGGLEELDCSDCTSLMYLPDPLPDSLVNLNCQGCILLLSDNPIVLEQIDIDANRKRHLQL